MPPPKRPPASTALRFVRPERLDALLTPLVPDTSDRAFVLRCLVGEGPLHHRGSNYLLLSLLERVVGAMPGGDGQPTESVEVPMHLPPHLEAQVEADSFPVRLPVRALRQLVEPGELEAAVDCLTDGPPQHSLANVVMVALLDRLLSRLEPGP